MRIFSSNGDILWLALLLYTKVLFFCPEWDFWLSPRGSVNYQFEIDWRCEVLPVYLPLLSPLDSRDTLQLLQTLNWINL